jgi:hypothetical protein
MAYTLGRVALHMALATAPSLRKPKPRRSKLFHWIALAYLAPGMAAMSTVAALWILRRGL